MRVARTTARPAKTPADVAPTCYPQRKTSAHGEIRKSEATSRRRGRLRKLPPSLRLWRTGRRALALRTHITSRVRPRRSVSRSRVFALVPCLPFGVRKRWFYPTIAPQLTALIFGFRRKVDRTQIIKRIDPGTMSVGPLRLDGIATHYRTFEEPEAFCRESDV
jgi:hypothetical protein